jgi:carbon-monoxide dehydrogenase medium subunit
VHTTRRDVPAAEFFVGDRKTLLEPGEMVTAATFPCVERAAYVKFLNPAARYAMVGVFAALVADGTPRVAVTGARPDGAFRWREAEAALARAFVADRLRGVSLTSNDLAKDLFADAAYRAQEVLARRAVILANTPGSGAGVAVFSHGSPPAGPLACLSMHESSVPSESDQTGLG